MLMEVREEKELNKINLSGEDQKLLEWPDQRYGAFYKGGSRGQLKWMIT